jgi:hypothetical protein
VRADRPGGGARQVPRVELNREGQSFARWNKTDLRAELPVFETADPRYAWLNAVLAVGCGERVAGGVRHFIYAII